MNIERIIEILNSSSCEIQAAGSFSERLDAVYEILDKAFPQTSALAAIYGPITSLTDYMSRTEIEPLLRVLEIISQTGQKYVTSDKELNSVLEVIYEYVEK